MRIDSPQRDSAHPVEQVDRPIAGPLGRWTRNPVLRTLASGPVGVTRSTAGPGALVDRRGPMVLGTARRVVGDYQLAEDVFQATFLVLARRAGRIRRPEALPGWLHRTAYHIGRNAARA